MVLEHWYVALNHTSVSPTSGIKAMIQLGGEASWFLVLDHGFKGE